MDTFREKFGKFHQELSNCKNDLSLIRLEKNIDDDSLKEKERLDRRITEIEQELKKLIPESCDY